jgi:DNA-binding winged helix-turn-helix (wHTH) protein/Tol biopolymer transport system component
MPDVLHFDEFELDRAAFELRRAGRVVRLERIPLELLLYLAERPGQLVTRDEILERIWGKGVFVDTDNAINTAVRKIRQALRDDAEKPRYVMTVPGKGYRFAADFSAPQTPFVVAAPVTKPTPDPSPASQLRRWRPVAVGLGAAALMLIAAVYIVQFLQTKQTSTTRLASLEELKIVQLTTSGDAERPALSPDGKYVAYIRRQGEQFSIWVRQIATGSDVEILPPAAGIRLHGLTVTPDAGFVDVVRQDPTQGRALWRVPFLGGSPRRLIDSVDSSIGWAPDGRHLAFVRGQLGRGRTALIVADQDGTNERELASRETPTAFIGFSLPGAFNAPAWSPNGRSIAVLGQSGTGSANAVREVVFVQVANGAMRSQPIPASGFGRGVAWLDDNTLVINHGVAPESARQLWRLAVSDGRLSRLSNDLNDYDGVSLTQDGRTLATGRRESRVSVWVGDGNGDRMVETIPPAPFGSLLTSAVLTWAGDRLLYTAMNAGRLGIMRVVPGRDAPIEILPSAVFPAGSFDGRTIVFQREGLWKVDGEGRSPTRLTTDGFVPVIAPDGRRVVFISSQNGVQSPWTVPIEGGAPTQVVNAFVASVLSLDVSPDSNSIVFSSTDDSGQRIVVVCDLPTCASKRTLTLPFGGVGRIKWTSNGRGLAFMDATESNVWIQLLDGHPPQQVTRFADRRLITDFAWSPDGTRLAVARASTTSDIVLFHGLRR